VVAVIDPSGFQELLRRSNTEPAVVLRPMVQEYVEAYARAFPVAADFLVFLLDAHRQELSFNAVGGFNITVNAPEAGLGVFVNIPVAPELEDVRSYIYLARKDSLVLGPALHELAHAWGVRLREPEPLGDQGEISNNHWGFSSVGGQMGGWMPGTLQDLGQGQYQLSAGHIEPQGRSFNTVPYAALELYLMGWVDPREVDPIEVAVNPRLVSLFEFTADEIVDVTISQIIAGNGERRPSFENAPRQFEATCLILTDKFLGDEEWRFYSDSMDYFAFDGPMDIADAFPAERYAGEPIFELINTPDPEDPGRGFLNFFEASRGLADLEFVEVAPEDG
jgi:hypothetical protein